jgi:large subunit ribosomal protein L19
MNLLEKFNKKQVEKLKKEDGNLDKFSVGDTVKVEYKITEGNNTRIQAYEGVVIAISKQNNNMHATFTVRKISNGIGVERKFQLQSPLVHKVKLIRKGIVKRGKLYYLRNLFGKSARIKEKLDFNKIKEAKVNKKTPEKKEKKESK